MSKEEATTKKTEAPTKKTEEPTKKTEAKEEGAASKQATVVYFKKRKRTQIYGVAALVVVTIVVSALVWTVTQHPRVPLFTLKGPYLDSISNTSVMVKLSSTNTSPETRFYYSKISLHIWIEGGFETEKVFLESTFQEPHEVTTWTAVVASNDDIRDKPGGSFQRRDGVINVDVIADLSIQRKSGIPSSKFGLQVKCPVLLNLKDLTSMVTNPMSTCSHHFT